MDFEIDGNKYQTRRLDLFKQAHLLAKFGPLITGIFAKIIKSGVKITKDNVAEILFGGDVNLVELAAKELQQMPPADIDYVIQTCLGVTVRQSGTGWQNTITPDGQIMFSDLNLGGLFKIIRHVVEDHARGFFSESPSGSRGA